MGEMRGVRGGASGTRESGGDERGEREQRDRRESDEREQREQRESDETEGDDKEKQKGVRSEEEEWVVESEEEEDGVLSEAPVTLVSASSEDYFDRLRNLVGSVHAAEPDLQILVYDMGLTREQRREVRKTRWNLTSL